MRDRAPDKTMVTELMIREAACRILALDKDFTEEDVRKAYRRAAMRYHPDRNSDDPNAHQRFMLIKCAYELLSGGKPCDLLLTEISSWSCPPETTGFRMDNPWGYFLWWQDKFF